MSVSPSDGVPPATVTPTGAPVSVQPSDSVPPATVTPIGGPVSVPPSDGVPPATVSPTEGPVVSTPVSLPDDKVSTTGFVPVNPVSISPTGGPASYTPSVTNPGENIPSSNIVAPTTTYQEPPASTGLQPPVIVSPTLSSTADLPGTTGGVPPTLVLPSSTQQISLPGSEPPGPTTSPIVFGPSTILSASGTAQSTEPGPPEPSATGATASPIIFGPSGTVSPTPAPIGTSISDLHPAAGTSMTTNADVQPTSSGYGALTSGTGDAKSIPPSGTTSLGVAPIETGNTASGLAIGTATDSGVPDKVSQTQPTIPASGVSSPVAATTDAALPVSGESTAGNLPSTGLGSASLPIQTASPSENPAALATSQASDAATASRPAESGPQAASASATATPEIATSDTGSTPTVTNPTGPRLQQPTGTDTLTQVVVPSSIVADPTKSAPTATESFGPTGIPSDLPKIITPPYGVPQPPPNTTLIQIGFLYPLNYAFVLAHMESQQQIFKYLPQGIADGLDIPVTNVTMQTLRAYDTTRDLGYITTLALCYVPAEQVNMLNLILKTPSNPIYNNPDKSVKTILSMINPAIPILSDNIINGASPSQNSASPSSSASGSVNEGAPIGNVDQSSPVRASSVGIAAGVVCGAAAYGAAMFFVARRYRKRKQSHRRSPSMFGSPVMTGSPHDFIGGANTALMSGGRGDPDRSISPGFYHARDSRGSGRSASTGRQQISAPVMAENSLGWN